LRTLTPIKLYKLYKRILTRQLVLTFKKKNQTFYRTERELTVKREWWSTVHN